ncbi:MAG TPA: class I SAM-dependent methyltransferase [Candidatus Bathyarchaeia archaeon]|nr:class I SAM-dependent methyltransferase [Candidatus Bathyarchaeia archaeon]
MEPSPLDERRLGKVARPAMEPNAEIVEQLVDDFDAVACEYCEDYKTAGLSSSSRLLLDSIITGGLTGKSLAELGCGPGGFTVESLKQGAASCVGIDLSPEMIKAANQLANSLGMSDRATFFVGNAAAVQIPRSDIVVMDKMLCCFPDAEVILKNAIGACNETVAFVVPRDQGLFLIPLRVGVYFKNLVEKIRGKKVGWLYLHSLRTIDNMLQRSGFTNKKRVTSGFWLVFTYSKNGKPIS